MFKASDSLSCKKPITLHVHTSLQVEGEKPSSDISLKWCFLLLFQSQKYQTQQFSLTQILMGDICLQGSVMSTRVRLPFKTTSVIASLSFLIKN